MSNPNSNRPKHRLYLVKGEGERLWQAALSATTSTRGSTFGHSTCRGWPTVVRISNPIGLRAAQDDDEHEVPLDWRAPFERIVSAFLAKDFQLLDHPIDRVEPIAPSSAKSIAYNIAVYGDPLAALSAATWERSIYRWMDGYWQFLVDLTTDEEEVSDLTLHARLDDAPTARLKVQSVHIP